MPVVSPITAPDSIHDHHEITPAHHPQSNPKLDSPRTIDLMIRHPTRPETHPSIHPILNRVPTPPCPISEGRGSASWLM